MRRLGRDERGGVAMILGLSAVPLLLAVGAGIELTNWMLVKTQLQRTADLAALAGAKEYLIGSNPREAANAAANLAEMNGIQGGTSRTWDPAKLLMTDNRAVAQITAGVRDPEATAVKVTVSQPISLVLTSLLSSVRSVTLTATGSANVGGTTVQPCLFALEQGGLGIDARGSVSVNLTGCAVRSNASISTVGNAYLSAEAFYAAGTITGDERGGPRYPNRKVLPDPYATNAPVQNALSTAKSANGPALSVKPNKSLPLSPGSWSEWDIKGDVSLASGIYYVNGNISLGAQATLSGSGVTIVTTGVVDMNGGATIELTAAQVGQSVEGAIPGIVFAGSSTSDSSFLGNSGSYLTGVVYNPNGALEFGGTAQNGSKGCLQVIAKSVTLKGNPNMASKCEMYGVRPVANDASTVSLVE